MAQPRRPLRSTFRGFRSAMQAWFFHEEMRIDRQIEMGWLVVVLSIDRPSLARPYIYTPHHTASSDIQSSRHPVGSIGPRFSSVVVVVSSAGCQDDTSILPPCIYGRSVYSAARSLARVRRVLSSGRRRDQMYERWGRGRTHRNLCALPADRRSHRAPSRGAKATVRSLNCPPSHGVVSLLPTHLYLLY